MGFGCRRGRKGGRRGCSGRRCRRGAVEISISKSGSGWMGV